MSVNTWKWLGFGVELALSSDIIRIRLEKIRKYSLLGLEYEIEFVRILSVYLNSRFEFEFEIIQKYSKLFKNRIMRQTGQKLSKNVAKIIPKIHSKPPYHAQEPR